VDELQQKYTDAETRLAEAASQAAHYKNLVDEMRQQRADGDARLQDAHSKLAEEQSAREAAEEEVRSLRAKLSRFPTRLFVR
jgi:chromosome segregation ATPase